MNRLSNIKIQLLIVLFLVSLGLPLAAQDEAAPTDNSLNGQFQELKESSNNYQEYEVIRVTALNSFWKNVQDSLAQHRQELQQANNRINAQQQDISRLTNDVQTRDASLQEAEGKISNLSVLGMEVEKENFVVFFWVMLAVLLAIIAIVLYKHRYSQQYAQKRHKEYEELDAEYNDYKLRAREKETKLMRDLQTERNTIEELNQRLASRGKA